MKRIEIKYQKESGRLVIHDKSKYIGKIPNATHAKKQFDLKAFYAFQNLYCDLRDLTLRIHIDFFFTCR